jgi:tRNA threonylcarbamoyladenosine biosynthesis protein TsaB
MGGDHRMQRLAKRLAYTASMTDVTLLAFDTSGASLSVALVHRGVPVAERDEPGGARASARLIPAALELLSAAGLQPREVDAFAFGRGPGAFTGLRTACSVAQGLAFGAGRPVLAIDSLQIVAEMARAAGDVDVSNPLWVAVDARMDEIYAASYLRGAAGWQALEAPALYTLPALNERLRSEAPQQAVGNALAAFGERLWLDASARHEPSGSRAAALGRLALEAWCRGETLPPEQALPLYLRDKVALTTAEREARRTEATERPA